MKESKIITNVRVEHTILYGPHKGERCITCFMWGDPIIDELLKDEKAQGKIVDEI